MLAKFFKMIHGHPLIIVDSNRKLPRATISAGPGKIDIVTLPAKVQGAGRSKHPHRTVHQLPSHGGGRGSGRAGPGAHGLPRAPLKEANVQGMPVDHPHKRYVGAIRKARMPLQLRSQASASRSRNPRRTPRTADSPRSGSPTRGPGTMAGIEFFDPRRSHVHLQLKTRPMLSSSCRVLMPAPVAMEISVSAVPESSGRNRSAAPPRSASRCPRSRCGCRRNSTTRWHASAPSVGSSRIQPSAPTPVLRSQMARAAAAKSASPAGRSLRHVRRKSLRAPCAFTNGIVGHARSSVQKDVNLRNSSKRASISGRSSVRNRSTPKRSQQKLPITEP